MTIVARILPTGLAVGAPASAMFAVSAADAIINTKAEEFVFPPEVKGIIDVTKAPYFADPTGKRDCTTVLIRAIDDMMREDHTLTQEARPIVCGVKKQGKETKQLHWDELPHRDKEFIVVPMYVGQNGNSKP
ncbi:MAG: hypothetical protein WCS42_14150 [Verrucomicrobiota bacterium]